MYMQSCVFPFYFFIYFFILFYLLLNKSKRKTIKKDIKEEEDPQNYTTKNWIDIYKDTFFEQQMKLGTYGIILISLF